MPTSTSRAAAPHVSCCIAYLRVSTDKQGVSGLGVDAQREAVRRWAEHRGARISAEYVEAESGRVRNRPELARALAHAKRTGCTLLVAKLDRLTRNARFLLELLDAGAPVAFADMPQMEGPQGRFMLGVMAQVAELEAGLISQRTRAALAAAKARGTKLGNPNGAAPLRRYHAKRKRIGAPHAGTVAAQAQAVARASGLAEVLDGLQREGFVGRRALAAELNRRGIRAPRGGRWHPNSVTRLLLRGARP